MREQRSWDAAGLKPHQRRILTRPAFHTSWPSSSLCPSFFICPTSKISREMKPSSSYQRSLEDRLDKKGCSESISDHQMLQWRCWLETTESNWADICWRRCLLATCDLWEEWSHSFAVCWSAVWDLWQEGLLWCGSSDLGIGKTSSICGYCFSSHFSLSFFSLCISLSFFHFLPLTRFGF